MRAPEIMVLRMTIKLFFAGFLAISLLSGCSHPQSTAATNPAAQASNETPIRLRACKPARERFGPGRRWRCPLRRFDRNSLVGDKVR